MIVDRLVDDSVILDGGVPRCSADQTEPFHLVVCHGCIQFKLTNEFACGMFILDEFVYQNWFKFDGWQFRLVV